MKVQKKIDVYLVKKRNARPIEIVQADTAVQLVFTVKDFEIPTGTTATLFVQKPSGKFVYQETGITVDGNTITIDLENQAIIEKGNFPYQLGLKNGTDEITTFEGLMMVDRSLKDSAAEESKTVIRAFDKVVLEKLNEFQTRAEQFAQAVIATIPEDYTVMEAKVNESANAIKGMLKGEVVVADDVSPVEHLMDVKVRGKNLIPFPYDNTSGVINGITYTVNDDGSVTAKGTATANAAFYLMREMAGIKGTIFMSGCPEGGSISSNSGGGYSLRMNKLTGNSWSTGTTDSGNGGKITLDGETISVYIVVLSGKTVDCTFHPMLNYGDSANEFVKSELTNVTVRRCGKNIFKVAAKTQTINGVTFTVNNDGTVIANGTAEKTTFIGLGSLLLKPDEKYRLSGSPDGSGFDTYLLYIHNNTTGADIYDLGEGKVFTGKEGDLGVTIAVYAGNTVNNLIFRPMVVYGEESEPFEPYKGISYIPSSDGTVTGMTSLSPNMTILTDTEGMIVECEYNVETKKFIKKYLSEIKSARIGEVRLTANGWVGASSPYSQVVHIDGVTENSQVDLTPSIEQLAVFYEKDLGFVTENVDGVVTVYAIGQKPQNDYTIQVTITEVDYD